MIYWIITIFNTDNDVILSRNCFTDYELVKEVKTFTQSMRKGERIEIKKSNT